MYITVIFLIWFWINVFHCFDERDNHGKIILESEYKKVDSWLINKIFQIDSIKSTRKITACNSSCGTLNQESHSYQSICNNIFPRIITGDTNSRESNNLNTSDKITRLQWYRKSQIFDLYFIRNLFSFGDHVMSSIQKDSDPQIVTDNLDSIDWGSNDNSSLKFDRYFLSKNPPFAKN